jgi:tripartite-type tricarboxylate transporter receptor subunit TctC|nr:MAG: C4-dicarboxylate ABC transporter substrate-binding protein [Pseudomonadota bacterium]
MITRLFSVIAAAIAAAGALVSSAFAADWPTKDVTYIIPFNAGGESDVTARLQEPKFKELTGHGFVIQYKPGAGGAMAWSQLNSLPGDGYTIMGFNLPHLFLQPMTGKVGYKTEDITIVSVFQLTPHALIVHADSPIKTLEDYIEEAKKAPGAITVAGTGTHSANQVAQVTFDKAVGIKTTYVPFTGTAATTAALLGKQVKAQWAFTTVGVEQKDKVRLLAVAMEERHPLFPDVPTFKEKGINLVGGAYRGIAVPKGVPEETRKQISDIFMKINQDPAFVAKMQEGGYVLVNIGYEQAPEFMAKLGKEFVEIGKDLGLIQ